MSAVEVDTPIEHVRVRGDGGRWALVAAVLGVAESYKTIAQRTEWFTDLCQVMAEAHRAGDWARDRVLAEHGLLSKWPRLTKAEMADLCRKVYLQACRDLRAAAARGLEG